MEFSNRDDVCASLLHSQQSGQAVLEYILVLVVTVALVLGGIYQLNSAFKVWAGNYFGDYIACLLETGELPTIDGNGGDSGICNQMFKAYSFADGRPLIAPGQVGSGSGGGSGGGSADSHGGQEGSNQSSVGSGATAGGYHEGSGSAHRNTSGSASSSNFASGRFSRSGSGSGSSGRSREGQDKETNTGNLEAGNYGTSSTNRGRAAATKDRLDSHFAFDDQKDEPQKRKSVSTVRGNTSEGNTSSKILRTRSRHKAELEAGESSELTFGDYLRYLIIAAIVIALAVFLGGQLVQIEKSME